MTAKTYSTNPFNPWTYKPTKLKHDGMTVYEAYFYDEFVGYRYRTHAKQLKKVKGELKEVNVGWQYIRIPAEFISK